MAALGQTHKSIKQLVNEVEELWEQYPVPSYAKVDPKISTLAGLCEQISDLTESGYIQYAVGCESADYGFVLKPLYIDVTAEQRPEDFLSGWGVEVNDAHHTGFQCIEVLESLKGKPWDIAALGLVYGLRPKSIRVASYDQALTADSRYGRVTVCLDQDELISEITLEAEVGLYGGITCGEHLRVVQEYGIDSPQSLWYVQDPDDPTVSFLYDAVGYYRITKSGKKILFPTRDERRK